MPLYSVLDPWYVGVAVAFPLTAITILHLLPFPACTTLHCFLDFCDIIATSHLEVSQSISNTLIVNGTSNMDLDVSCIPVKLQWSSFELEDGRSLPCRGDENDLQNQEA